MIGMGKAYNRSSHALPVIVGCPKQEEAYLVSPTEGRKMFSTLLPQQEEGRFSPPLAMAQPMRDSHNLASEKPRHFELPVSFNRLFITTPPNFSFPL